jgi:hypothetical protein
MTTVYVLGENPFIYVPLPTGLPNADGFFRTLDAVTGEPKPVFLDQAGSFPAPNPVPLTMAGITQTPIYWQITTGEDLYTLDILDSHGNLLYSIPNYPSNGGSGGDIVVNNNVVNYARNEQFAFWNYGTSFDNTVLLVGTTQIADDWYYTRSNADATLVISQYNFVAGDGEFPFSPTSALRFTVTAASLDVTSYFSQFYNSVQTLTNQVATFSFWAKTVNALGTAPLNLILSQNFGVGGSPSIVTSIASYVISDAALQYTSTFTLPDIGGNTIGTNSNIQLIIQTDPNVIQDIIITDVQFQSGTGSGADFPYITENEQYVKLLPDILIGDVPTTGTDIIGIGGLVTPGIFANLTDYLQYLNETSNSVEYLIGWLFKLNPNQFGQAIASVFSGEYVADQTIVVSDGNGVVSKNSFTGGPLGLVVLTAGAKFGIFQIIEENTSASINFTTVSLSARVAPTTGTSTFKMAVLGWSGGVGAMSRQCVATWNAPGTNPTLATNWNYASDIKTFTVTASDDPPFQALNNIVMSTPYVSYAVLIWNDSADIAMGNGVIFYEGSLSDGYIARVNNNQDFGQVLRQCQRYLYRTYDYQIVTAAGAITGVYSNALTLFVEADTQFAARSSLFPINYSIGSTTNIYSSAQITWVTFPQTMYRDAVVLTYNPFTGASGSGYLNPLTTSMTLISGTLNIAATSSGTSETGTNLVISANQAEYQIASSGSFNYYPVFYIHYVADATLGV